MITRRQRRPAILAERKLKKKMRTHACVLDRAAVNAGVAIQLTQGAEHHRLHVAMGEPWCTACEACKRLRLAKRPPTILAPHEVAAMLNLWARKIEAAKEVA